MTCKEYMENLFNALMGNYTNTSKYYAEKKGALRLARDFGYGVADSPKEEWGIVKESYQFICVPFYKNNPPIDEVEWIYEIWSAVESRLN